MVDKVHEFMEFVELINIKEIQTLIFSTNFSEDKKEAAMYHLKTDYLSLTVGCVGDEEYTEIREPDSLDKTPLVLSGSVWGHSVSSRKVHLEQTVTDLAYQVDELSISMRKSQERNDQLQKYVDNLTSKIEVISTLMMKSQERNNQLLRQNDLLVKKLSAHTQDKTLANSTPDFVTIDKDSMSQLLASCESFQNKLDAMSDRQHKVEDTQRWLVSQINVEKLNY